MTKEEAIKWLDENPRVKTMLEGLAADGILEKMDSMDHADSPGCLGKRVNLVEIARLAGLTDQ